MLNCSLQGCVNVPTESDKLLDPHSLHTVGDVVTIQQKSHELCMELHIRVVRLITGNFFLADEFLEAAK